MSDTPTVRAEIERKTLETFTRAVERYEAKEVSDREMVIILDTIWDLVGGFLTLDTAEMISETADAVKLKDDVVNRRFFRKGAQLVTLEAAPWPQTTLYSVKNPGTHGAEASLLKDFSEEAQPWKTREAAIAVAAKRLETAGYCEF